MDNKLIERLIEQLGELRDENTRFKQRIKRLEDAGDEVSEILSSKTPKAHCVCHIAPPCSDCVEHWGSREALANWREAKEDKP